MELESISISDDHYTYTAYQMQDSLMDSLYSPDQYQTAINALETQESLPPLTWLPELSLAAHD